MLNRYGGPLKCNLRLKSQQIIELQGFAYSLLAMCGGAFGGHQTCRRCMSNHRAHLARDRGQRDVFCLQMGEALDKVGSKDTPKRLPLQGDITISKGAVGQLP